MPYASPLATKPLETLLTTKNRPVNVLSALQYGQQTLKAAWQGQYFSAPQNPSLDTQVLLAHILGWSKSQVFIHGEHELSPNEEHFFHELISRRVKREPVAYITGKKWFFGREFSVTPDTLIPRPDTELLIEKALELCTPKTTILDIGTGSGAIAVTLSCETGLPTYAIDISESALTIAKQNATHLGATSVYFSIGNLLKSESGTRRVPDSDVLLICANLPYLSENQWSALDVDVKNYEPKSALVGGTRGDECYEELFMQIAAHHRHLGAQPVHILCEIDPGQKDTLPLLAKTYFSNCTCTVYNDIRGFPRLCIVKV